MNCTPPWRDKVSVFGITYAMNGSLASMTTSRTDVSQMPLKPWSTGGFRRPQLVSRSIMDGVSGVDPPRPWRELDFGVSMALSRND